MLADFFSSGTLIAICIYCGLFAWTKFIENRTFKAIANSAEGDTVKNDAKAISKKFLLIVKLRWLRDRREIFSSHINNKINNTLNSYYISFVSALIFIIFVVGAYLFPVNQ